MRNACVRNDADDLTPLNIFASSKRAMIVSYAVPLARTALKHLVNNRDRRRVSVSASVTAFLLSSDPQRREVSAETCRGLLQCMECLECPALRQRLRARLPLFRTVEPLAVDAR